MLLNVSLIFYLGMIVTSIPRAKVVLERFYCLMKETPSVSIFSQIIWFISIIALCYIRAINSYIISMKKYAVTLGKRIFVSANL